MRMKYPEWHIRFLLFHDYLKRGYYPFGQEAAFDIALMQVVVQTMESDIPQYMEFECFSRSEIEATSNGSGRKRAL